nr:MAG TPA: hypothetical protein [Caudoviricetes sp.]
MFISFSFHFRSSVFALYHILHNISILWNYMLNMSWLLIVLKL